MSRNTLIMLACAATLVVFSSPARAIDGRTRREVTRRVEASHPDVKWDKKAIQEVDINCDGNADFGIGGRGNGVYHVAVVIGPIDRTSGALVVDIPTAGDSAILCDQNPTLLVQSSDYDASQMLGGVAPEGFHQELSCSEFAIGLECTKFHIYWNHVASRLGIWQ